MYCPSTAHYATNPTWTDPRSKTSRHVERPTANCLSQVNMTNQWREGIKFIFYEHVSELYVFNKTKAN